jgi:hypothetical protein
VQHDAAARSVARSIARRHALYRNTAESGGHRYLERRRPRSRPIGRLVWPFNVTVAGDSDGASAARRCLERVEKTIVAEPDHGLAIGFGVSASLRCTRSIAPWNGRHVPGC